MDIKVLLQAFRNDWFIEPTAAEHYALLAFQIITGERTSLIDEKSEPKEFAYVVNAAGKRIGGISDAVDNGVAVLSLEGAVMKHDYCGTPGTQSLMKALQQANDNPAVSAIVLQIDSPGGSVDGTQQFANAIKNSAKPVVAYVDGMMCSAAMWIGSGAQQRIASSNTDVIGSIGTMAKWKNFDGYYKTKGIQSHEVYATNSTQKNLPFREAEGRNEQGQSNYKPLIETWLDPMNDEFTGNIQTNLPDADKSVLNGKAYIATDAKKKGLVDKIGSFNDAVNAALKLSKQQQTTHLKNMKFSQKYPKLAAALGVDADSTIADIKVDAFLLNCDAIENALTENNNEALIAERDTLVSEKTTLSETIASLNASITEKDEAISTLTTEKEQLQSDKTNLENDKVTLNTKITELGKLTAGSFTTSAGEEDKNEPVAKGANDFDFQKEIYNRI